MLSVTLLRLWSAWANGGLIQYLTQHTLSIMSVFPKAGKSTAVSYQVQLCVVAFHGSGHIENKPSILPTTMLSAVLNLCHGFVLQLQGKAVAASEVCLFDAR